MPTVTGAISGLVLGAGYGLTGWAKNKETFRWRPFLETVIPSCIIGAYAGYLGMTWEVVSTGTIGVGITQIIKKVLKLIFKKL